MQISKDYLENVAARRRPLKITSERQELIQRIAEKINAERVGTRFKPATCRQINSLVSFFSVSDLYWLESVCGKSKSFSKKFFGVLRDTRVASLQSKK
jgi:hypothetical protein